LYTFAYAYLKNFFELKTVYPCVFILIFFGFFFVSCQNSSPQNGSVDGVLLVENAMQNKGIGPITELTLSKIDTSLARFGKSLFKAQCVNCHKIDERYIGPALKGIAQRRSPEWIMNMMLNPIVMTQKDRIAIKLLSIYSTQMLVQNLTKEDARSILEYLRTE